MHDQLILREARIPRFLFQLGLERQAFGLFLHSWYMYVTSLHTFSCWKVRKVNPRRPLGDLVCGHFSEKKGVRFLDLREGLYCGQKGESQAPPRFYIYHNVHNAYTRHQVSKTLYYTMYT